MSNVIEKTPSPSTPPSGRVGGVLEKSDSVRLPDAIGARARARGTPANGAQHGEKGPVATDRPLDVEIEQ